MFRRITTIERLTKLAMENANLSLENLKLRADLDYMAMETGIDIDDTEEEPTNE